MPGLAADCAADPSALALFNPPFSTEQLLHTEQFMYRRPTIDTIMYRKQLADLYMRCDARDRALEEHDVAYNELLELKGEGRGQAWGKGFNDMGWFPPLAIRRSVCLQCVSPLSSPLRLCGVRGRADGGPATVASRDWGVLLLVRPLPGVPRAPTLWGSRSGAQGFGNLAQC